VIARFKTYGNAGRSDRLGDHAVALRDSPGDENLSGGSVGLLGNLLNRLVSNDGRATGDVLSERGVGGDVDVLLGAVLEELSLLKERVRLDLVDGAVEVEWSISVLSERSPKAGEGSGGR
jgi:hypothetical protein